MPPAARWAARPPPPEHPGGTAHPPPERDGGQTVQFGIFDPITDFIADPVGYSQQALPGLNAASMRVLAALPVNVIRLIQEYQDGTRAADAWTQQLVVLLVNSPGQPALYDHLIHGLTEGAFMAGEILGAVIDVLGVNEVRPCAVCHQWRASARSTPARRRLRAGCIRRG